MKINGNGIGLNAEGNSENEGRGERQTAYGNERSNGASATLHATTKQRCIADLGPGTLAQGTHLALATTVK